MNKQKCQTLIANYNNVLNLLMMSWDREVSAANWFLHSYHQYSLPILSKAAKNQSSGVVFPNMVNVSEKGDIM